MDNHLIGKIMISASLAVTAVGLFIQDWNATHVFNPKWLPHARFHCITGSVMNFLFSSLALYILWFIDEGFSVQAAALTPVICWGSFFIAAAVPGSEIEDVPGEVPRWLGLPINMLFPGLFALLSLAGMIVYTNNY